MSIQELSYTELRHMHNVRCSTLLLFRLKAAAAGFDPDELVALAVAPRIRIREEAPPEPEPEPDPTPRPIIREVPTVLALRQLVCSHYKVREHEVTSERRTAKICRIRQVAWYLTKEFTPASYPQIGHYYGDRDHTTVMSGVRKIEEQEQNDDGLRGELDQLRVKINEKWPMPQAAE